jgi:hypothetical protein
MPRPPLDVVRAEFNIFKRDKATMIKHYGQGWTGIIRELVEDHCAMIRRSVPVNTTKQQTAEDFDDE